MIELTNRNPKPVERESHFFLRTGFFFFYNLGKCFNHEKWNWQIPSKGYQKASRIPQNQPITNP